MQGGRIDSLDFFEHTVTCTVWLVMVGVEARALVNPGAL